jgi:hypothetical protein
MRAHRRAAAALGVLLLLPLAGALAGSIAFTASCDHDCGDMGGRGLFILVLLCTPPAALGLLAIARTTSGSAAGCLAGRAVVAVILLCTLTLAGSAIAAGIEGLQELSREPVSHRIGVPEPTAYDRQQAREAGIFWLIIATVLAAMAATAVLALRAAWRLRH